MTNMALMDTKKIMSVKTWTNFVRLTSPAANFTLLEKATKSLCDLIKTMPMLVTYSKLIESSLRVHL